MPCIYWLFFLDRVVFLEGHKSMTRQSLKTLTTLQIHDESNLPSWLTKTLCLAVVVMMLMPYLLEGKPFELRMLTIIFLYAVLGHGWNILGGYAGQTSLGHGVSQILIRRSSRKENSYLYK